MPVAKSQEKTDKFAIAAALDEWAAAIGSAHVDASYDVCQRYGRSTSPWSQKPIGVLCPKSTREVQDIVQIAARHGVPLYPISGGKNWGLGDACPTSPGQVVVDLRRLNRIREVNEELGYAVVEAGVTQGQLYEHLKEYAPCLMYDATGAGPDATIIGNIMERGYGHSPYGDRYQHSCNYEIVLASGDLLRTGDGALEGAKTAHLAKAGLGPSLDGLFTQSNLGIVTSMTIWLMPRPEHVEAFAFKVDDESLLGAIVDALRPLRQQGVLTSLIHIANDLRVISSKTTYPYKVTSRATPLPYSDRMNLRKYYRVGAWNALGGIYGPRKTIRGTRNAIRHALRNVAKPIFVNDRRLSLAKKGAAVANTFGLVRPLQQQLSSIESVFELLQGKPVAEHLRGAAWRRRQPLESTDPRDPLDRGDGLVWLSPKLPMLGADADYVYKTASSVLGSHGFDPLVTFISISGRLMCSPTTICYDKHCKQQSAQAQACYNALFGMLLKDGYPPYRLGAQSMHSAVHSQRNTTQVLLAELGATLNSRSTLAPNRYSHYSAAKKTEKGC